jgi:4-hydroxy-3-methylbut-2-enyl diphosphate reductase
MSDPVSLPPLSLLIAAPRGFCAGVDRAIRIVELAIAKHKAPVYVRHEIVHNRYVVDGLKAKGAIFVEELDEVPNGVPVVFSAHGVPKTVPLDAERRGLDYLDATCPLVSKVHRQAERLVEAGRHILFIGHRGHPEVIGTFGQVPDGRMTLIETAADAEALAPADPENLAFLTQTTLSVDDTAEMIAILLRRFPAIQAPRGEDICYATSNRQAAVKAIAAQCDAMLVIGAPNSSNSLRLVEVAERSGVKQPYIASIERGRRDASVAARSALDAALALRPSAALAARRDAVRQVFVAARLGEPKVFGSVARGEDRIDSDLDLLVEFTDHHDIVDLLDLEDELRRLLTVRTELVDARARGVVVERAAAEAVPL